MMTVSFRPGTVRDNNIKVVLSCLYGARYSCKELSELVDLSDVAVNKIIRDMLSQGLVRRAPDEAGACGAGRRHIRYEADGNRGVYVLFEFTPLREAYYIFDFSGKLLERRSFSAPRVMTLDEVRDVFADAAGTVRRIGIPPLCAVLSVPGQVNPVTKKFYLSGRFNAFVEADLSPADMAGDMLGCEVLLDNNAHFMAFGNVIEEELTDQTVAYVFAGEGVSMSLMYRGQLVIGEAGFAGEVGYDRIFGAGTLSERCSLIALEKKCAALTGCAPDAVSLFAAFRTDERVRSIVRESAEQLGYYVNNLVNGTGVDCVIIGGECKAFGDLYLDAVRAVSDKYCTHPAPIRFERSDAPSVSGMMDTARRFAVDRIVGSGAAADVPPCEKS